MALSRTRHHVQKIAQLLCLLMCGSMFTSGCSSKPSIQPQQQKVELHLAEILSEQPVSLSSLRVVAKQAGFEQNWLVVWKSQLLLCQLESNIKAKYQACDRANYAVNLLADNRQLLYKTALTRYLQTQDKDALIEARRLADTNQEKAAVLLAEGEIPSRSLSASIPASSIQQAQLLYLRGKQNSDLIELSQALVLFKKHRQMHKAADTLFVIAQLQFEAGHLDNANISASESLLILDNLRSQEAFLHVKDWYDDRLSSG